MGIVVDTGGGPTGEFIGGRYWRDPGPTKNGFKGSVQFSSLQHFHMVSLSLLLYLLLNNQTHARPFQLHADLSSGVSLSCSLGLLPLLVCLCHRTRTI